MSAPKFSLSFSRKIEKKSLQPSAIHSEAPAALHNTHALTTIEENVLHTDGNVEETELVIPMVQGNRSAIFRKLEEKLEQGSSTPGSPQQQVEGTEMGAKTKDGKRKPEENGSRVEEDDKKIKEEKEDKKPLTLDEQAAAALLQESQSRLEQWDQRGSKDSNLSISAPAPDTSLTTPVPDVGKESNLDDYDRIEVASYGAALLRGMGWKKSEGVGGKSTGKKVVEVIDPSVKTFNLMGQKEAETQGKRPAEGEEEELTLAKGSYVFLHCGRNKGAYGVVEAVDEDHLLVKVAVSQKVVREVEFNVRVVTQQEFKKSSRVINKDMYDKFKEKEAKNKDDSSKSPKDSDELPSREKRTQGKESSRGSTRDKHDTGSPSEAEDAQHSQHNYDRKGEADHRKEKKSVNENKKVGNDDRHKQEFKREKDDKYGEEHKREKGDKYSEEYKKDDDKYRQKYKKEKDNDRYQGEKSRQYDDKYYYYSSEKEKIKEKYSSSKSASKSKREAEEVRGGQVVRKQQRVEEQRPVIPWVRENLRVRLINKAYKGGKYHKQKVVVCSVETAESCECRTQEGRVLRQVHPQWLETVIPKTPPQLILIVKGPHKGQLAHILQLHKQEEKASVQMVEDETFILKLHYDDICEYVQR